MPAAKKPATKPAPDAAEETPQDEATTEEETSEDVTPEEEEDAPEAAVVSDDAPVEPIACRFAGVDESRMHESATRSLVTPEDLARVPEDS